MNSSRQRDMNLLARVLPDFSARLCGRSIGALLFRCQGRVEVFSYPVPAQAVAWSVRNTPSLPLDCSSEFSGSADPSPARALHHRCPPPNLSRLPMLRGNRLVHSGVSRSASLATVGGEISIWISFELSGTPLMNVLPVGKTRPHWKKSGQCQAGHNCSGGSKEEPDFS